MNQETLRPGLVSVTFRKRAPENIVKLCRRAGLESIEWGGDVHVPHGDLSAARDVRRLTESENLRTAAYGSYYRAGSSEAEGLSFDSVLATAVELNAPTIRVWPGRVGPARASDDDWRRTTDDLLRIADVAASAKITISLEHHRDTLTETLDSMDRILRECDHPNLFTLWQPPHVESLDHNVESLRRVLPRLTNVHVFHWRLPDLDRRPLAEGEPRWQRYLEVLRADARPRELLLEFVREDSEDQLLRDGATLREWL